MKKTNLDLELQANADMLLIVEKCIKGGMQARMYTKHEKSSNKYDSSTESQKLIYLDVSILYGLKISK